MKKIYLIAGALIGGLSVNAQINTNNSVGAKNERNEIRTNSKKATNHAKVEGQVHWTNAFDVPAEWAQTTGAGHTAGDWAIISAIPSNITSQQAGYQWPATFSGATGNFAFINSDDAGTSATQDAYFEFQTAIDLSSAGNAAMYLTFAEYYRHYYDQNYVEVSNDNGVTWTVFQVNPEAEVPVNTNCVDGEVETVNITPAKGPGAWTNQVKVRFHYVGAWDWFWGIDDVQIVEAWDNDIKITNWYQSTDIATTQALDYYYIPTSQASFPGLTFGANVINNGALDQASVALTATGTGGYNETGTSVAITATMGDSLEIIVPYMPTGIGTKTVNVTTTIAGTDSDLTNNTASFDMFVNDYQYSRDNNIQSGSIGQISSQDGQPLKIGNIMEIFDDMVVTNVAIRLSTQAAGAVGGEYFAELYLYNFTTSEWEFYAETGIGVVASTAAAWVTLPIVGGTTPLTAGDVVLVVAGHFGGTDEVRFAYAQNTVEGTVQGFDATGAAFSLTSPGAIMIRLSDEPLGLTEMENNFGLNVYPNPANTNTTVSFELNNEATVAVNVTDLSGKVVYTNNLGTVNGTQKMNINTDSFSSGIYMVNVTVDGSVSTQKLVVRK